MKNKGNKKAELWERRFNLLSRIIYKGLTTVPNLYQDSETAHHLIQRDIKYFEEHLKFIRMFDKSNVISMCFAPPADSRFIRRLEKNLPEKKAICQYAFDEYITSGDKIYIDGGTTTLLLAYFIACSSLENLDVTTNDISILRFLIEKVRPVRIVGGMLRKESTMVLKSDFHDLSKEGLRKSFIGFDGLSYNDGVFGAYDHVDTQRNAAMAAKELIVFVGHHSKISKSPWTRFISFEELEQEGKNYVVVTDSNFPDETVKSIVEAEKRKFPDGRFITVEVPEE